MNLIIPLRNGSPNKYYELRFALRSICQHNLIDRCILVGGKPDWYVGDHIPFPDYDQYRKEENIRDKTNAGAQLIGGDFMYSNDDFFVTAPYPGLHNKGLLSDCLKNRNPAGSYTRLLKNTLTHFGDIPNVDTHAPMVMNTEGVERTMFDWPQWGLAFKTTYAAVNGLDSVYHPDCKVMDVADVVPGYYFSTYENSKNMEKLLEMWATPSIFEK